MANLNLNNVILVGRLTADPELKNTPSGVAVTTFTVAVNRNYQKDEQREADFINCVAWRQTAEFVCRYFRKGGSICVIGSIQTRKYTTQNGENRYAVEVVADEIRFVDSKSDTGTVQTQNSAYMPEAYQSAPTFEEVTADDEDLPF